MLQRDQHQAKPDADPAEIARAGDRAAAEHQDAEQDQQERDRRHVERQHLDDQRRADIGAEHDGQRRDEIDEPAGREGA